MTFEKGKSGNPSGRKRNTFMTDALLIEAKEREKDGDKRGMRRIAVKLFDQAEEGDIRSAEFIRDTLDGKPVQAIEGDIAHGIADPLMELFSNIAKNGKRLVHDSDDQR